MGEEEREAQSQDWDGSKSSVQRDRGRVDGRAAETNGWWEVVEKGRCDGAMMGRLVGG